MTKDSPAVADALTYKAFISYSHAADARFAPALQQALQQLSSRWYQRRAIHVFRDQTDLSAAPQLWPTIEHALGQSEFFLLLASPQAAASTWVAREVDYWLAHRSADSIVIVLTHGEIVWDDVGNCFDRTATTALPPALVDRYSDQPLFVDFRWAQRDEAVALNDDAYRDAVGTIAATLHGVAKSILVGKDLREHKRRLALARTAVIAMLVLLAASLAATGVAFVQRQTAQTERDRAVARELATWAADSLPSDPERTLILALYSHALVPGAVSTLPQLVHDALSASSVRATYRPDGRPVYGVRWSPAGDRIVSSHERLVLRIWSARDGQEIAAREGSSGGWSVDGTYLTAVVKDSFVLDPLDSREVRRIPLPSEIGPYVLSADRRLLAVPMGQNLRILDAESGATLGDVIRRPDREEAVIMTLDWHPQLPYLLVATDASYEIWDLFKPDRPVMQRRRAGSVDAARWSPSGESIATLQSGIGGAAQIRVEPQFGRGFELSLPLIARDMRWSHDNRSIALVGVDGAIVIVSVERRAIEFQRVGHANVVQSVSWSPDDTRIATASEDGTVKIWQVRNTGEVGGLWTRLAEVVDYSPATRRLAVAGPLFPSVSIWDVADGKELSRLSNSRLEGPSNGRGAQLDALVFSRVGTLKWSPSGGHLAVVTLRTNPKDASTSLQTDVWEHDAKAPVRTFPKKRLLAWSSDGSQLVFEAPGGVEIQPLDESAAARSHAVDGSIEDVEWSPTSTTVAVATGSGLTLLDAQTGARRTVEIADQPCRLVWSADGARLAVRSERSIDVVDIATLKSTRYEALPGSSCELRWSSDGTQLASAAPGGIVVRNGTNGRATATLRTQRVLVLSWERAGHHLTAVDGEGRVMTWEMDEQNLYRIAHARVTRPLTAGECERYFGTLQCPPLPPRP